MKTIVVAIFFLGAAFSLGYFAGNTWPVKEKRVEHRLLSMWSEGNREIIDKYLTEGWTIYRLYPQKFERGGSGGWVILQRKNADR